MFNETCRCRGHTFLLHRDLPTHFSFYQRDQSRARPAGEPEPEPGPGQIYSAVQLLIEQEVVWREVRGAEERFHLARYWKAEAGSVQGLEAVLSRPPWILELALQEDRFARMQGMPRRWWRPAASWIDPPIDRAAPGSYAWVLDINFIWD